MSAAKPPTATPAVQPSKPLAINMPKVGGKGGKVLGAINNLTPQVTGESVSDTLETLEKVGVKDDIEEKIKEHDNENDVEKTDEKKKITRRLLRLNLIVTYLLFYTALMIQWLTLLGISTSVGSFFYEFFINSFNFPKYNFSSLTTIGKIAGVTVSLQIIIFVLTNFFVLGNNLRKNKSEQNSRGILNNNSNNNDKFQNIKKKLQIHLAAVRKIAGQFYQIIGILSQILIIIAASIVADDKLTAINDYANAANNLDPTLFPFSLTPGGNYRKRQEPATIAEQTLAVKHAALFAKTITAIAILAIIMTSFMNIITWMADIWEINKNELIIYKLFKYITRLMVCYPCFGDKLSGADEKIDDKTSEQESLELANKANKKPQSAEKILNDAQQNVLKNPNSNDLINTTLGGPTQNDIDKISGENKVKNSEGSNKEKKDLSNLAKDGVEKVLGGDEKGKNAETIDLAKNGIDVAKKVSEAATSGEGEKPNIEKLASEGIQTAVTATGADKNPDTNIIPQGIKTVTEIIDGNGGGKPNVEKLVNEGIQTAVTATGTDKNPDTNIISQGIKTVVEAVEGKSDEKQK